MFAVYYFTPCLSILSDRLLGAVFLLLFGVGLVFWLLAVLDYALKKDKVIYLTADQLRTKAAAPPMLDTTRTFILIGAIVASCVGCMIFSAIASPRDRSRPASGQSELATVDPSPNTPTPRPTSTPRQGNSDLPAEVATYLVVVTRESENLGTALSDLGLLLQTPDFFSDDWRLDVAIQMAIVQSSHERLASLTPPASMANFHRDLTSATSDCSQATVYMAKGIDETDVATMETAVEFLNSCTSKVDNLEPRLKDALSQF